MISCALVTSRGVFFVLADICRDLKVSDVSSRIRHADASGGGLQNHIIV